MKRKSILAAVLAFLGAVVFVGCSDSGSAPTNTAAGTTETATAQEEVHGNLIKPEDVQLTKPLNAEWVSAGKGIYEMKCQSCHKLTDEKLVGPGWKDVTKKREPHWVLNMITNVDVMLEKDAEAQKLLEQCLVRMPNQNVSKDDARKILEFMRSNDGEK
jgi:cytochrome c551/c552